MDFYNLDVIISVGYRVKSVRGTQFRQWATNVLREHLLRGFSVNSRLNQLEDKMDRRLAKHEQDIVELRERVDFVVQSALPPPEMVFMEGEFLTAHEAIRKIVRVAKKRIDETVWLCGSSVKDAGRRMFALVKMAMKPEVILGELPR